MNLRGRLALIAGKVTKADTVADIGTDHAYIPIYLIKKGVCKRAIATDIRKGPIRAATSNIANAGLENNIETRLGDGLEPIHENEADVIIIAGMGGTLIKNILEAGKTVAKSSRSLIIQPMNRSYDVREWLYDNSFDVYDDELCAEGEHIYNVICAKFNDSLEKEKIEGNREAVKQMIEFYIGKKIIEKNDPLLKKLLSRKIKQLDRSIEELKNASEDTKHIMNEYSQLRNELAEILKSL